MKAACSENSPVEALQNIRAQLGQILPAMTCRQLYIEPHQPVQGTPYLSACRHQPQCWSDSKATPASDAMRRGKLARQAWFPGQADEWDVPISHT